MLLLKDSLLSLHIYLTEHGDHVYYDKNDTGPSREMLICPPC